MYAVTAADWRYRWKLALVALAGKIWSLPLAISSNGARHWLSQATRVAWSGAKLAKLTWRMARAGPGMPASCFSLGCLSVSGGHAELCGHDVDVGVEPGLGEQSVVDAECVGPGEVDLAARGGGCGRNSAGVLALEVPAAADQVAVLAASAVSPGRARPASVRARGFISRLLGQGTDLGFNRNCNHRRRVGSQCRHESLPDFCL